MRKALITSALAIATMTTTTHAASIVIGGGAQNNAGGLSNVVDGDNLDFGSNGLDFSGTGDDSAVFTVTEGGKSVTLRMHFNVVGTVNPNRNAPGLESGESITISFDIVSGGLDSFTMTDYVVRNAQSSIDGRAGEGFTVSDNLLNSNTWYSIEFDNTNQSMIKGSKTIVSDSNYVGGNPNVDGSQVGAAGLNVLSESNLDAWSWTLAGVDGGITGDGTDIAFNQINLSITPSAVPEPSSTALLGLGGLALILRRRK